MRSKGILYTGLGLIVLFVFYFLFTLDKGESNSGSGDIKGRYTGANGEVVIVAAKEGEEKRIADSIAAYLSKPMRGLPGAPEPHFDVGRVSRNDMTELLKRHRNLFIIEHSADEEHDARLTSGKDQWADGQLLFRIRGSDADSMLHSFRKNAERIMERVDEEERERLMGGYDDAYSKEIREELLEAHGIGLKLPGGSEIKKREERFVWVERQRQRPVGGRKHDVIQGIFLYYYPYEKKEELEKEALLKKRDSVLKAHVPGPSEGSYMTTEDRIPEVAPPSAAPRLQEFEFKGEYAAQIRGLWRIENDQMGGPFISLSTYDKERNRIVTVEGYVFAPKFDKREYLRQLQAMIYSLEFADPPSS